MECNQIKPITDQIRANISKVIVGNTNAIDLVLTTLIASGNILLEDVPGTGKTLLAKSLAKSIECEYNRIQFTPDLLPSDVTGINFFNQQKGVFMFKPGPIFANIILADEINRATPRTQSSLLECMEEIQVTVDGETRMLSRPFFVIATQNPIETGGTFPLPEAQLDRFMMKIDVGLPSHDDEITIMERFNMVSPLESLNAVCTKNEIFEMQHTISKVYLHPSIKDYLVKIVNKTRIDKDISAGVSPRGTLAFMRASQAYAAIQGRSFVIPEDIKFLAPYVIAHRLIMASAYNRKDTTIEAVNTILSEIVVPTEDFSKRE